jgi:hypothetical protein
MLLLMGLFGVFQFGKLSLQSCKMLQLQPAKPSASQAEFSEVFFF